MTPHRIACSGFRCDFLTAFVPLVALVFLLGAGTAQAATVILDPTDSTKATGIVNLDIDGALFNVEFTNPQVGASTYGVFPGDLLLFLDIPGKSEAISDVMDLINLQLNLEGGVLGVGSAGPEPRSGNYFIGYQTQTSLDVEQILAWESDEIGTWSKTATSALDYNADSVAWADLTPVPEPGTALLMGLGLAGLGAAGRSRRDEDESKATT